MCLLRRNLTSSVCHLLVFLWLLSPSMLMAEEIETGRSKSEKNWQHLMQQIKPLSWFAQLNAINQFFNAIPFQSDYQTWGRQDYWASPDELLAKNAGDCEDYAVAKYISLVKLGLAPQRLKLAYVQIGNNNFSIQQYRLAPAAGQGRSGFQSHMVLLYFEHESAVPWVLDNINATVLPVSQRSDLTPVYGFNDEGMWLFNGWQSTQSLGLAMRPSHWLDVKKRMIH